MKYLRKVSKSSFLTVFLTIQSIILHHQPKNDWKKNKILSLENQEIPLAQTFSIHNSGTKIVSGKHFEQNASQESYI